MLFGHLAISGLLHHYLGADFKAVMAGGLFPDVVDKSLCQVLRVTPSGRMYAHTLLGVAVSTGAVSLIWGRRTARAWALGYLGHLAGDGPWKVPLFYPLLRYEFADREPNLFRIMQVAMSDKVRMGAEFALLVWAAYVLLSRRDRGSLNA
jgi:hypothetical protein